MERPVSHSFDVGHVAERLAAGNGGYEIVHESPGVEVGVYVLVAPEPDRQQPHEWDEIYVVLEGTGVLEVEGEPVQLEKGARSSSAPGPTIASPRTSTSRCSCSSTSRRPSSDPSGMSRVPLALKLATTSSPARGRGAPRTRR